MKTKNKMVSFRLSAEEYDRLRQAGACYGVSSLSELARVAMTRMLDAHPSPPDNLAEKFQDLRLRIEVLSSELQRLSRTVTEGRE